ncbi:uncharacterized protein LOC142221419 [Haematobia irritans]|uniref:uncharacterized protein LOC142221419 n=1 Tax=Haematobia irritans TaxID=7368 RepID=UPI003F506863
MAAYKKIQLNLDIDVDVLTVESIAEIVNTILKALLYQRNQIPFVYETYKYYVGNWLKNGNRQENFGEIASFQLQRQRDHATDTYDSINAMKDVINETFKWRTIKTLRFLFGGTVFTPKESYTVHIPCNDIMIDHSSENHRIHPSKLNGILLSLLTNHDLYSIFSQNLNATNLYLELELFDYPSAFAATYCSTNRKMFPKDLYIVPSTCKDIHIYLQHKRCANVDYRQLECCKEIKIFEDIINLSLTEKGRGQADNGSLLVKEEYNTRWWESEIIVRGFKEHSRKGLNIWS